jgi:hypothetical protein
MEHHDMDEGNERYEQFERKFLGHCLFEKTEGRRMISVMTIRNTARTCVVVRHFEADVKRSKGWPKQEACYVYLPIEDDGTYDGMDKVFEAYVEKYRPPE